MRAWAPWQQDCGNEVVPNAGQVGGLTSQRHLLREGFGVNGVSMSPYQIRPTHESIGGLLIANHGDPRLDACLGPGRVVLKPITTHRTRQHEDFSVVFCFSAAWRYNPPRHRSGRSHTGAAGFRGRRTRLARPRTLSAPNGRDTDGVRPGSVLHSCCAAAPS